MTTPEPLSAAERAAFASIPKWGVMATVWFARWEATVQAVEVERDALREERWRLRAALEEILSDPTDDGPHPDYGCLDLHEARWIASTALRREEPTDA